MKITLGKSTKRKLTRLANLVEKMPNSQFDFDSWSSELTDCKTTYCAVGYGVVKNVFDNLHLKGGCRPQLVHTSGAENIAAVVAELGIPYPDVENLFTDVGYNGKVDRRAVVRRLRAYVANPNNPTIGNRYHKLFKDRQYFAQEEAEIAAEIAAEAL